MKTYIGTKTVKARPMTRAEAEALLKRDIGGARPLTADGYLVEYKDGYQSWSPKGAFDEAYREFPGEAGVATAMGEVRAALHADPEYAWSWHCNIAMASVDEGMEHGAANRAAARFMNLCFGVDTKRNRHYSETIEVKQAPAGGRFRKKPVVIEAITFEDFVAHGLAACRAEGRDSNIVNGLPWAFSYQGQPITHETDNCYLIPTLEGTMRFERGDMLITGVKGEIYPCKADIFAATYEPA